MNRKIRIAQLLNYVDRAGKEVGIIKLVKHMNRDIFDPVLVVVNAILIPEMLEQSNCRHICLEQPGGHNIRLPLLLRRVFREQAFDIVHTRSWVNLIDGIVAARLARAPVVIHQEHGTFPQEWRHRKLQPVFWGMADRMLAVSGVLRDKLSSVTGFPAERIEVVLNGVEGSRFFADEALRSRFRQQHGIDDQTVVIGFAGRMTPVKNVPLLLKAARALIDQNTAMRLLIAGGGPQEEELRQLAAQMSLGSHVSFIGLQQDMNAFYNGIDIFTLTSLSEGCSNVIQEATFVGRPVVATRVGGNPELVVHEKTGLLVPSDDPPALSAALRTLCDAAAQRRAFGEAAARHGRENFSIEQMVRNYERIYLSAYLDARPRERDGHFQAYLADIG